MRDIYRNSGGGGELTPEQMQNITMHSYDFQCRAIKRLVVCNNWDVKEFFGPIENSSSLLLSAVIRGTG